jgi:NAD(P)-dependent dehydrogenase (short-subunit alcohol dehydrogenase family)
MTPQTSSAKPLAGKVAIVTGAGRGLGHAEALALAQAGAKVVVNDLGAATSGQGTDRSVAQVCVDEIRAAGGEAVANCDTVATMEGAKRIIETALDSFGRLDILVNNAGNIKPSPVQEMSEDDWDSLVAVHLKGHFATVRHASPIFCKQRSGVIVNTASESGLGHLWMSNYSAVKEGIVGFTRAIARDLGMYNVRCNAIRPRGMSRLGTPEVMATVRKSQNELGYAAHGTRWVQEDGEIPLPPQVGIFVTWLCTDAASNVNGRTFFAGGGEVALYGEPLIERSIFSPTGWTLDLLNDKATRAYLIGDLKNVFAGPAKT